MKCILPIPHGLSFPLQCANNTIEIAQTTNALLTKTEQPISEDYSHSRRGGILVLAVPYPPPAKPPRTGRFGSVQLTCFHQDPSSVTALSVYSFKRYQNNLHRHKL